LTEDNYTMPNQMSNTKPKPILELVTNPNYERNDNQKIEYNNFKIIENERYNNKKIKISKISLDNNIECKTLVF